VEEESHRRAIFEQNVELVKSHNVQNDLGVKSFRIGVNKFSDLTSDEFRARNGYRPRATNERRAKVRSFKNIKLEDVPDTVDWRDKGIVTPVKDQGQCGSCWAFSAVASLEGQHALATKKLVSLSEQNLVDCSQAEGNNGCEGGLMDDAFQYIIDNKGIDTEESYPYEAEDDQCRYKKKSRGAGVTGFVDIPSGDEDALLKAAATIGPISVAIDAGNPSFQAYTDGIYVEESCSSTELDHGVTVVGYGSDNGQDYWLVKNSWGEGWGIGGYIKMARNKDNQCGIATDASYPKV